MDPFGCSVAAKEADEDDATLLSARELLLDHQPSGRDFELRTDDTVSFISPVLA